MIPHEILQEDIDRLAGEYAASFRLDADDVRQELYLWWYTPASQTYIEKQLLDDDENDGRLGHNRLVRSLRNRAVSYGLYEKAERLGGDPGDIYFYSPAQIARAVPAVIEGGGIWPSGSYDDSHVSVADPAEGGNLAAILADVSTAIDKLVPEDRTYLEMVHDTGYHWEAVAVVEGYTYEQSASQRWHRIVRRMQRSLGGPRPKGWADYIGSRRVQTNAAAQAATRTAWSGE